MYAIRLHENINCSLQRIAIIRFILGCTNINSNADVFLDLVCFIFVLQKLFVFHMSMLLCLDHQVVTRTNQGKREQMMRTGQSIA